MLEDVGHGGGGQVAQQVGQEVPPRLEELQHSQAHDVVQVEVLERRQLLVTVVAFTTVTLDLSV